MSGFADAEGTFNADFHKRKNSLTGYKFSLRFILDQNCEAVLLNLKNLFGFGTVYLRKETKRTYRYVSTGNVNLLQVADYFRKFKLHTKKAKAFEKWCITLDLLGGNCHLTAEGAADLKALGKQINIIASVTGKTGAK